MSALITGSTAVLPFRNSRGQDRIRKINDALVCGGITVPVGYVSDGASIPRLFWRAVGHPFSPLFVRPALVHDIRCEFRVGSWQDTHDQFRETLRAEGVGGRRAGFMHLAVRHFGPRWGRHEAITVDDLAGIIASRDWGAYDG